MPSYLDLGVLAIILVSALLAMLRGFTREILAIASWVAAAAAAYYLHPLLLPYIKPYISKDIWAMVAAATIVFFVALILVSIITINISDAILDSKVGALDRSLGFLFGAARGFLLCVIAFLFFAKMSSAEKLPEWARNARMRPVLQSVGDDMAAMLPNNEFLNKIMKKTPAGADEPPPEGDATTPPTDKTDIDRDSPAPLPPPRDTGGKEP